MISSIDYTHALEALTDEINALNIELTTCKDNTKESIEQDINIKNQERLDIFCQIRSEVVMLADQLKYVDSSSSELTIITSKIMEYNNILKIYGNV